MRRLPRPWFYCLAAILFLGLLHALAFHGTGSAKPPAVPKKAPDDAAPKAAPAAPVPIFRKFVRSAVRTTPQATAAPPPARWRLPPTPTKPAVRCK